MRKEGKKDREEEGREGRSSVEEGEMEWRKKDGGKGRRKREERKGREGGRQAFVFTCALCSFKDDLLAPTLFGLLIETDQVLAASVVKIWGIPGPSWGGRGTRKGLELDRKWEQLKKGMWARIHLVEHIKDDQRKPWPMNPERLSIT